MATALTLESPRKLRSFVSDDEPSYEVIDGIRVELPPMSFFAKRLATVFSYKLESYGETQDRGFSVVEGLFGFTSPINRDRRPDVAFVTSQRWPRTRPIPHPDDVWEMVPDLAVEIVSPSDKAEDLLGKILEYFRAGVRLVWVVYPELSYVQVYESPTLIRGLLRTDTLDGGTVLPGFSLPLASLFPEPAA